MFQSQGNKMMGCKLRCLGSKRQKVELLKCPVPHGDHPCFLYMLIHVNMLLGHMWLVDKWCQLYDVNIRIEDIDVIWSIMYRYLLPLAHRN